MVIPQYMMITAAYRFVTTKTLIEIREYFHLSKTKAAKLLRIPRTSLSEYEKRTDNKDINLLGVRYRYMVCIFFKELTVDKEKFVKEYFLGENGNV